MAVGTAAAIGLGAAALGGAIAGGSDSNTYSTKNVGPMSEKERLLQEQAFKNYNQSQDLSGQYEQGISNAAQYQQQARDVAGNIMNGSAFNITPEQQAQIEAVRNASVNAGTYDINNFVDQRLQQVQGDAANRGVRGQAYSQLQTGAIGEGTQQIGRLVNQANVTAAQQAMDNPYRQAMAQGQMSNQYSGLADQMRQQAIANRTQLSNPALMNNMQRERLDSAGVTNTTPGSLSGAITGALGGAGSALGAIGGFNKAMGSGGATTAAPITGAATTSGSFDRGSVGASPSLGGNLNFGTAPQFKAHGGWVDGEKKYAGDTIANDNQVVLATPGEFFIPESHSKHKDLAIAYVKHMFDQKNKEKKGS